MTDRIGVLVVDDHRMFTDALQVLLTGEPDIDFQASCVTGEEAIEHCLRQCPDVVLADVDLPGGIDGVEVTRRVMETCPGARVIIITAFQEPEIMAGAVEAGAAGFVPKARTADELLDVVRRVAAGGIVLPAEIVLSAFTRMDQARNARNETQALLQRLTGRELSVLEKLADGKSTVELAQTLFVSPATVQGYVKSILSKLGVHSKLEAVMLALRHGVIRLESAPGSHGGGYGGR